MKYVCQDLLKLTVRYLLMYTRLKIRNLVGCWREKGKKGG